MESLTTWHDYELVVDNFAGAGGASKGIEAALGRPVDIAINHSRKAVAAHKVNHPDTLHLCEDVWDVDPVKATAGRPVGLAWFSPDCKHFSKAKGGKPLSKRIRGLAWVAIKWARLVRPRVIILENVEEFQTWGPLGVKGKPLRAKAGQTFRRWKGQLRKLGYQVEHRPLVAADFGTPTTRKRVFLVARCDGQSIHWPARTHAPQDKAAGMQLRPWQSAASCIDWAIPCKSIFERQRPLAAATLTRIARGLVRYVIEAKEPFIVCCNHAGDGFRGQAIHQPLRTVTGSRDAVGIVSPTMVQVGYGERTGQAPRVPGLDKPLGTVVAGGCKHALVSAFMQEIQHASHEKGCLDMLRPCPTLTAHPRGGGHALVATHLTKLYGTSQAGQSAAMPMPTITATGQHIGEVRAFLVKYYGTGGQDQSCLVPMHTITAKARLGLVTVAGQEYQIADIGLRMLEPAELLRAQFGRHADGYTLIGSKADQVAAIGNSVCPELAEAIVKANVTLQKTGGTSLEGIAS